MEGHITHTAITSYSYGTLQLKEVPTSQGLYLFYTTYLFHTTFLINFVLPSGNLLHMSTNFFHDPPLCNSSLQLNFVTQSHDSLSRLHFMTPLRNSLSRLHFTTPIHDHHSKLTVSRLPHHVTPTLMDGLCQHPGVISLAFQP